MRTALAVILVLVVKTSFAMDCSEVKPFTSIGTQKASISVSRFHWSGGGQPQVEEVCRGSVSFTAYDVRGREEEAYYCLKPPLNEVYFCDTCLNGDPAQITVVPASWIRSWKPQPVREYRFHSYIVKTEDPGYYYDVFARTLSANLAPQDVIVEGSLKTGPSNPEDGFFVSVQFAK